MCKLRGAWAVSYIQRCIDLHMHRMFRSAVCYILGRYACAFPSREFSQRGKSTSMSNWNMDEVVTIEWSVGNADDEQIFLASYSHHDYPRPDSTQRDKMREFIRMKCIEVRWMRHDRRAVSAPQRVVKVKKEKMVKPPVVD
jgi:hypothetical protein